MNRFLKLLALALVFGMMASAMFGCGEGDKEAETTDTPYETLDDDGWSPIWRP